ncbi:MAG: hypothetical protein ABI321_07310 [Polyangia bacterium]
MKLSATVRGTQRVLLMAASLAGCAHRAKLADAPRPEPAMRRHSAQLASVELVYHGDQAFARRGNEEWPIAEVPRSELVFSPDGHRFAYVRPSKTPLAPYRMVIRNIAGDPVNEFSLYRAGKPESVVWLDDRRIGYVAPAVPEQKLPAAYVVHDMATGEVLRARSGAAFVWGPERKHVAFIAGAGVKQNLIVDGKTVWPRRGSSRLPQPPVWSPDGHGLAFVDTGVTTATKLVVLAEYDDPDGDLTWPVPKDAVAPGLHVFWAGDTKIVIGETALRPRFAAGWEQLRR